MVARQIVLIDIPGPEDMFQICFFISEYSHLKFWNLILGFSFQDTPSCRDDFKTQPAVDQAAAIVLNNNKQRTGQKWWSTAGEVLKSPLGELNQCVWHKNFMKPITCKS